MLASLCLLLNLLTVPNFTNGKRTHHYEIIEEDIPESTTGVNAPLTGKSFYGNLQRNDDDGEFFLQLMVGSQRQNIRAQLTTLNGRMTVIDSECDQ